MKRTFLFYFYLLSLIFYVVLHMIVRGISFPIMMNLLALVFYLKKGVEMKFDVKSLEEM